MTLHTDRTAYCGGRGQYPRKCGPDLDRTWIASQTRTRACTILRYQWLGFPQPTTRFESFTLNSRTKKHQYGVGLTLIESALRPPGGMVLGLYIYSAGVALQRSQSERADFRKLKFWSHLIGTPAIVSLNPGISQTELAQLLGCERATAGMQVAECIRNGWMKRVVSQRDRRRYELQLTTKGEKMLADARRIVALHEEQFLAPLTKSDRESLRLMLRKLIS